MRPLFLCPVCLRRWCVVAIAKRLHGCHLVRRCVGLDPSHILLDGDSTLPNRKGLSSRPLSQFTEACVCIIRGTCLLWLNGWMDEDATWYGGRPRLRRHRVRWGPSSPAERGTPPPPFGPCLLWLNGWVDQNTTGYGGRPRPS